ncbi:MAG TPA: HAMP domain-containing sensor histidine kinase [Kofleriaceae bacterium]|nr:HAMP domain-containing sensor histidine kinase [Kofleriaceae bacterium]
MKRPKDATESRAHTNESLTKERQRSDDELLARSSALSEDTDELIQRARERAREVLSLARAREDEELRRAGATDAVSEAVHDERSLADATLAAEHSSADAKRLDERERRRLALLAVLAHEREITDRTLAAERSIADRTLAAREDMLTLVAHDLRGMLSSILVGASGILLQPDLSHVVAASAARIQNVCGHMSQLLEDLVDVSSFEAGTLRLDTAEVNVAQLVRDAVEIHEPLADARGIAIAMQPHPDTLTVRVDARRFTRVLVNLISNALKFTPEGGRVEISLGVVDGECEIAVRDTGIGIPPEHLDEIFERFRQVGAGPRRSFGAGLGLYIARLITRAHGGRIWAESTPGAGATFRVRLPLTP